MVLFFGHQLIGQDYPGQGGSDIQKTTRLLLDETITDTIGVKFFTLDNINHLEEAEEPHLNKYEQYATFRQFKTGSLILGNLGSSHLRVRYSPRKYIWRDAGFHQYDNYKIHRNDLRFYKIGQPYNDLSFSPAGSQDNFTVGADYSMNFQNDINLTVDYKRINQDGLYSDQKTKQTAFAMGLWKNNPDKEHQCFITFLANNHNETQNGGIASIVPPRDFIQRNTEPRFLAEADTRHQNFSYAIDNFKSYKENTYKIHHQLAYDHGYYRFSDENTSTSNDSLIYSYMLTDDRGIRYFLGYNKIRNTVDVSFSRKGIGLTLGISHQYSRFKDDLQAFNFQELYGLGKANFKLKEKFQVSIDAQLGLGENIGNLFLASELKVTPVKGIDVYGLLEINRYDPSLLHERLILTEALIYQNEFAKINDLVIGGIVHVDFLDLKLELRSGLIDNAIAYDSFALPYQLTSSTEYLQASIEHSLRWKFIGIENQFLYQTFSENIYRLPEYYGIHNVFVEFPLFKRNLQTRVGCIYYSTKLGEGLKFLPATGAFYPSDTPDDDFNYYEAYATFKIKSFRLFLKIENMNDLFQPFEHYHINNYPQNDWRLRAGVNWVFRG